MSYYIKDISVRLNFVSDTSNLQITDDACQVVANDSSHPPENSLKELNTNWADINSGFHGK
jgi:hypothetical protein